MWIALGCMLTGFVAGVINTVAGGGSLLTLPVLMALGLNADVANGSNRLGVLAQSLMSTFVFVRHGQFDWGGVRRFVVPVVLGAMVGAQVSIALPEMWLRASIAVVMVAVLCSLWAQPKRWLRARPTGDSWPKWVLWPMLFMVGAYAGFIQAGAGILFLGVLVLGAGQSVVGANALKAGLVVLLTVPALFLFTGQGFVAWEEGLYLAVGQMVGGALGARITVHWGPSFVRWVLVIVVMVSLIGMAGWF